MRRTLSSGRFLVATVITVSTVFVLAACGSASGSSSSSTVAQAIGGGSTTTAAKPNELAALTAAGACMRQHGVNIPDPTLGPNGQPQFDRTALQSVPTSALQSAAQACQSKIAAAEALVPKSPNQVPQEVQFAQCMRQHGVSNFPDPDPAGSGFGQRVKQAGIDTTSPAFLSAQQACHSLLPSGVN